MMITQFHIFSIILIIIITGLSGCTQHTSSSDNLIPEETEIQTIPPMTESIQTILAKTDIIESLYYEIVASINISTYGTQSALIKIWQKTPYLKEQITSVTDGIPTIISLIQRPEGTYMYDIEQGKYILKTLTNPLSTPFVTALQSLNLEQIKSFINEQSMMNLQTEVIDGKTTTILLYTSPLPFGENTMSIKLWIWNEKGVPLKAYIEMMLQEKAMTVAFNYDNYSFSDIPDSIFNVI